MQISLPDSNKSTSEQNVLEKGTRSSQEFLAKFNHDWMIQLATGLAYNLMVAVVPIGIAVIAILGFTIGNLNPAAQAQLINRIQNVFPSAISSQNVLQPALTRLSKSAGFLAVLAVVTALFGGSRLFIAIERCFDIIYRTNPRKAIGQNVMALLMMLVFIFLIPVMVLASSLPSIILSLAQNSALNQLPGISQLVRNSLVLTAASILGSLLVSWILFQVIYMAVPNQKISFKNSWKGAVVAAILLEIFLAFFPLYITHFMSSYTGVAGFAIIFLLFFYYFALILLFGAEVNSYFAEGVKPLPATLAVVLHDAVIPQTGQMKEEALVQQLERNKMQSGAKAGAQAAASTQPADLRADSDISNGKASAEAKADTSQKHNPLAFLKRKKQPTRLPTKQKSQKKLQPATLIPAVAGTALAFGATLINLRKKTDQERVKSSKRARA